MKVLFAVSNENISTLIVKKYQKEYKEIISYKNVYYFNAILKEIQKDKSYDRIVISEDLEQQFSQSNYQQMDKFIFEKLDNISDEAYKNIPIIVICSERRQKGEDLLVKLFGIGVYDAVIGKDRSIDEVCNLIKNPRSKKEAKEYYKIEAENVNYKPENEEDVSEVELQNILAYYRRIGKNEEKYIEIFDNIASQYNDAQLKLICRILPLNVKAVLEERSTKYQQLMAFNKSVSEDIRNNSKSSKKLASGTTEKFLVSTNSEKILKHPVVIPSAIKASQPKKLTRITEQPKEEEKNIKIEDEIETLTNAINVLPEEITEKEEKVEETKKRRGRPPKEKEEIVEEVQQELVKKKRGRPPKAKKEEKVAIKDENQTILPGFEEENDDIELPGFTGKNNVLSEIQESILPGFDEDDDEDEGILPGFDEDEEEEDEESILPGFEDNDKEEEDILPGFDEENDEDEYDEENDGDEIGENTILPNIKEETKEETERTSLRNSSLEFNEELKAEKKIIEELLTSNKKIVTFVGTSKNGTSFILNNVAELLSSQGINVAILDTTQNRNSYYIYTKNEEDLRKTAFSSIENLIHGISKGIRVNNNLTVYTSLPNEKELTNEVEPILETLIKNHSLILIDCDYQTPLKYFGHAQEIYLVQSMDVLTIQPLTEFLRNMKAREILAESKLKVIINKYVRMKGIAEKEIIGGLSYYNDPSMSYMTELFDRREMKYITVPFEEDIYVRYLEGVAKCDISLKGYSKMFMQTLKQIGNSIYPQANGKISNTKSKNKKVASEFSESMNNTLNQMKKNY